MGINLQTPTFYNLNLSGINPAAVACYMLEPATSEELAKLEVLTVSGDLLSFEGDKAETLYTQFQQGGISIEEKQNAIDCLKAFFALKFSRASTYWKVDLGAKKVAEEALKVLGA